MSKKEVKLELIFDDYDALHGFVANWLDGGLDGGGNLDYETSFKVSKTGSIEHPVKFLRIKGTGEAIDWDTYE